MKAGDVRRTTSDGVASVEFSHPAKNSMPRALLERLAAEITAAHADPNAAVVLLRSAGDGPFCAGASFDELKAISDEASARSFFEGFARVMLAMVRGPKPVVVRVQGKAVGGGVGLIAAADYALASEAAEIRLSEIAIGIGPFTIGPVVERKISPAAFAELAWDSGWRGSAWAKARGLYQGVYPDLGSLDAAVAAQCGALSKFSTRAVAELKRVLWSGTESWEALLIERAAISARLVLTPEAKALIQGR